MSTLAGPPNGTQEGGLDRFFTLTLGLWAAVTAVFLVGNALLYAFGGGEIFDSVIQRGPVSGLKVTYASLAAVWLSCGLVLAVLRRPALRSRHGVMTVCSFLALLLYANVLRERSVYPDAGVYIRAAFDLHAGQSLDGHYIYPPLLAALIEPFVPLGRGTVKLALWGANLAAVPVFVWLLALTLGRYGFERRASALLVLVFTVVNAPLLRTLAYGQVNLHVLNLVLLALLAYPRFPVWSALSLALAVHLKSSPVVLALPFLLERNWRWTGAFVAWGSAVAGAIYAAHGAQPFLDVLHNVSGITGWSGASFRQTSIDALLRNPAELFGGPFRLLASPAAIVLLKGSVLVLALAAAWLAMRRASYVPRTREASRVLNGAPGLTLLMVLASPLVWVHHGVFAALPFLVTAGRLKGAGEWAFFSLAYSFVFLLPTFDFYPWSFARLGGLFILLALLLRTTRRTEEGDLLVALRTRGLAPSS